MKPLLDWPVGTNKYDGTFQLSPDGNGPLYRTNLCILMLEIYYSYPPSIK